MGQLSFPECSCNRRCGLWNEGRITLDLDCRRARQDCHPFSKQFSVHFARFSFCREVGLLVFCSAFEWLLSFDFHLPVRVLRHSFFACGRLCRPFYGLKICFFRRDKTSDYCKDDKPPAVFRAHNGTWFFYRMASTEILKFRLFFSDAGDGGDIDFLLSLGSHRCEICGKRKAEHYGIKTGRHFRIGRSRCPPELREEER